MNTGDDDDDDDDGKKKKKNEEKEEKAWGVVDESEATEEEREKRAAWTFSSGATPTRNANDNADDERDDGAFSPTFQPVPSEMNTPMNAFRQRDRRWEMEDATRESLDRESSSPMVFGRRDDAQNQSDASNGQDFLAQTKKKDDSAKTSPENKSEDDGENDIEAGRPEGEMEEENVEMKSPLPFLFKNKRRKEARRTKITRRKNTTETRIATAPCGHPLVRPHFSQESKPSDEYKGL